MTPDVISDFPDADGLTGKDLAEVDLTSTEAQSTALRDDDGEIVEGIFDRRQAAVGASRRLVEFGRVSTCSEPGAAARGCRHG